jgi:hypothetical protein
MIKDDILTMREFINDSFANVMNTQNLDPEFMDALSQKTKVLRDTKNILDTKNLANLMKTGTDKFPRVTNKNMKSDPLK